LLDRLDEALTFSNADASVRARLSGLLDVEGYHFTQPAPGLIFSDDHNLLNPRLTLFFDAQLGPHIYFFAQSRLDRGFDPADAPADMRLDEYAVRWTPFDDGRFNVQIGKFGTVVGNWMQRHQSWDNPFINGPLIYENMNAIYDSEAPATAHQFLEGIVDAKYDYNPVLWGPSYATGIAISGALGKFDYAFELKNASLSSRPESWNLSDVDLDHPTVSGRIGYRPSQAWNFGLSASEGAYLLDTVEDLLPAGHGMNDYKEIVLGQDISFAWHHWQLWAEFYEARFQVPNVGNADTFSYYLEAKYKFTPQLFGALRWNQQLYDTISNGEGGSMKWGHDLWRVDASVGYRFTPHTQLKLQYSVEHEDHSARDLGHLIAAQFTVRF
jgi:hypothetical protein